MRSQFVVRHDMKHHRTPAAAIVAAFNEEATIGEVVRILVASSAFEEIIVVSDGSIDATVECAREAGATIVHAFEKNRGKGAALAHGVMHTDLPVICFIDGDLKGLNEEHIRLLLNPVVRGKYYMNVGICDRGWFFSMVSSHLPLISGQRALRREVFDMIPLHFLSGYKVESALNYFCRVNRLPYGVVVLPGLSMVKKIGKVGIFRGILGYVRMFTQVVWGMIHVRFSRGQFKEHGTHMSHTHGRSNDEREW